jgi:hypothetical protein
MLTIAKNFAAEMAQIVAFVDLSSATFALARADLKRFRSKHALGIAAVDLHARARAASSGLPLACEGAFLTACAQFELAVRGVIEETANRAAAKKANFRSLPIVMQEEHVDGCARILQKWKLDKYKHLPPNVVINSLTTCYSKGVRYSLVVEAFSSNDANFRPETITKHMKKLGLNKLWEKLSRETCLQIYFGGVSVKDTSRFSAETLKSLMEKRNTIIHRGKSFASPSSKEVEDGAKFFSVLIEALANVTTTYVATL